MNKNRITSIIAVGLMFLSVGCDKLCKKTVQDFATIQNTTGRQLSLNVCKGRSYGEIQVVVPVSGTSQEVSLGSHEGSEVKGGPGASCGGVENSTEQMGISLAPASFGQVKLCYDEVSKLNLVIENYQACPSGYLEQTSTGACL